MSDENKSYAVNLTMENIDAICDVCSCAIWEYGSSLEGNPWWDLWEKAEKLKKDIDPSHEISYFT